MATPKAVSHFRLAGLVSAARSARERAPAPPPRRRRRRPGSAGALRLRRRRRQASTCAPPTRPPPHANPTSLLFSSRAQSFIDYLSTSSTALRRVLKEPQRSEALSRSNFKYREFTYALDEAGKEFKESAPSEFWSDPSLKPKK